MKAMTYSRFGAPDVLEERLVRAPSIRPGHARVRVHATALNPKDVLIRKGKMRWLSRAPFPRIPGYDVAGTLLDDADGLAAGAQVFGMVQNHRGGGCAEVVSLPFDQLAAKPPTLTMSEAASLPLAGMTALQALRDELQLRPGTRLMINGASGGVGTLTVQIAKALGATVIAVCSGRNAELVTELGADVAIDYQVASPREQRDLDAVFDCFGNLPWPIAKRCLRPGGRYCTAIPRPASIGRGLLRRVGLHRAALVVVRSRRRDLEALAALVERGELRPVIACVLPLENAAEAHRRIETRRTRGKIVLTLDEDAAAPA